MSCATWGHTPEPSSFSPHDSGTGSVTTPFDGFRTVTATDAVAPDATVNDAGEALHCNTDGGDCITVAGVRRVAGGGATRGTPTEGFAGTVVSATTTLAGALPLGSVAGVVVGDTAVTYVGVFESAMALLIVAVVGVSLALTRAAAD